MNSALPCDVGTYKATGKMNDACLDCPVTHYKTNIDYAGECSAHPMCGAGQFYAGYSTTALGSCTSCPADTFSTGWSGVSAPCTAQPTCAAGQFLSGGSTYSAGTCTACPANTYNADGQGSCDWHGQCPPGQQPSHFSKTTASSCEACPMYTYSASTSSHETCVPQTVCGSDSSLVGESSTASGTCVASCKDYNTGSNSDGGGNMVYLDRHQVTCPANAVVGAMGMTKAKIYRPSGDSVAYAYRCCDLDTNSEAAASVSTQYTSCSDDGGGNTVYLDRHNLNCGGSAVIKSFSYQRCSASESRYQFECAAHANANCQAMSTSCSDDGGGNLVYLDRHNVQCPSSKPFMSSLRLSRCSSNSVQMLYSCCN